MTEPLRVLHFADVHVGMENYGRTDPDTGLSSRVRDFLRRMDDIVNYARDNDADLVVFAGDAFKTRNPAPTFQREFAYRIQDLAEIAPVVLLVGNHDLPQNYMRASSIEIFETLRVPNVIVAAEYELHVIETKRGPVAVGAAPYPLPSWLLQGHKTTNMTISDQDLLMEEVLADKLGALVQEAAELDMPRLLTGHFTVSGARVGSERNVMLGRDVAVSLSMIADPTWDYIAMGHIHKHQDLTAKRDDLPPVVYSGSIERIDFGEEADPKGFCWVELERENTRWEYVTVDARPFVTIRMDLRERDNPTQALAARIRELDVRDAVVRIIVQLTPEGEGSFNEGSIRRLLWDRNVFYIAAVSKEIEQEARVRLGTSPEGLTPAELLERFLESKGVPGARRETLLDAASEIFGGADAD